MNIGEKFYCSRCLTELIEEEHCLKCGYSSFSQSDELALEEGTTLKNMRFHIGAVRKKLKHGYVYGAFDYINQKPVYIFEYFPAFTIGRDSESETVVIVPENLEIEFENGKAKIKAGLSSHHKTFAENNTLYVFRP